MHARLTQNTPSITVMNYARFHHGLESVMARCTRIIDSRPWWNVHV